jgi:small-conductance mechanosensitive channel
MGSDIMRAIKIAYDKAGIEIPYPYRTVVYKTDLDKAKADRLKNGK